MRLPFEQAKQVTRESAETLLADLERAEQLTNGWSNQPLGIALVSNALNRCLFALEATGWQGRENQLLSSEIWRIAGCRLECGLLQRRAREKPRGYAGDFETLVLYHEKSVCDHPLGKLFDIYFQRQAAVEAVRARIDLIAACIVEKILNRPVGTQCRIVSIGSGPAMELDIAFKMLPTEQRANCFVQLFDLDEAALDHAAERLRQHLPASRISTHRENLYRLGSSHHARNFQSADFIFCTGLFDYLPDEPAAAFLKFLWQKLNNNGSLMVGNFAPHNPSRSYMEWFGNWYLIYRTAEQLCTLAESAGIPTEQCRTLAERTGVNLFLLAEKSALTRLSRRRQQT